MFWNRLKRTWYVHMWWPMKPITNCNMPQANHAQPLVATLQNKRGSAARSGASSLWWISLFFSTVALCPFVINKALQQQIVTVFFGRESPAGEYWFILYMGPIKFISKVLKLKRNLLMAFQYLLICQDPVSYVLHLSILAYYFISSSSSPKEREYTPCI